MLSNLRVDADGVVRVPVAELGAAQSVRWVVVDPALCSTVESPLPQASPSPRDLRLRLALDPSRHFAEERSVAPALAGEPIAIPDVRTGKVELIGTVGRAHQLLATLAGDESLRELGFVADWASFDDATKRARYGKYAATSSTSSCGA